MDKYQETNSLALASFLNSSGYALSEVKTQPFGPQLIFCFDMPAELFDEMTNQFWSKSASVDALTYFECLKNLKSQIYQYKYKKGGQYGTQENDRPNYLGR